MNEMNLIIDRDLSLLFNDVYSRLNLPKPPNDDQLTIDLVEWILRIPDRRPRVVHRSSKLNSKILTPYELQGVRQITKTLQTGRDLRPFLGNTTSSIRNRAKSQNDFFFSDWGLLHFHLGLHLTPNQKAGRTRRTLYALIKPNEAYLIDVRPHAKDQFGQIEVLEILVKNWPELLENHKLSSILPTPKVSQFTPNEIVNLRTKGVNQAITINNEVYMGPGGGIVSDTSSFKAVRLSDEIRSELSYLAKAFYETGYIAKVNLFVDKDASIGFFDSIKNIAYIVCPARTSSLKVTWFFERLIDEVGIFKGAPEGAMWCL